MNHTASITQKITDIETQLFAGYTERPSVSLLNGNGGLALFYFNLYTSSRNDLYRTRAEMVIDHVLDQVNRDITSFTYCDGLTGLAFLLNYLGEKEFIGEDIQPFLSECDEILEGVFLKALEAANHDYLHGAMGMAIYFLDRSAKNTVTASRMKKTGSLLTAVLSEQLKQGMEKNEFIPGTGAAGDRYVNCGMAHGLVSQLMFLSKYYARVDDSAGVREILRNTTDRLLQFKSGDPSTLAAFPSIVRISGDKTASTYEIPLGWCYGDTTVSVGLYAAGKALQDEALMEEAFALALASTKRITKRSSLVCDACFCHGSSGVAHIYNKWYRTTGHPGFKAGYEFWIDKTVELCHFEDGIGGYKKFAGETWSAEYGLLDGACGAAMVLSDFPGSGLPDWDRFFLLS